jgi:2-C-methyl-D-erythritol 4-phosphate cytidylyltransferase
MKKYAVIVAGGQGSRMNNVVPKQFLPIDGKPLLYYSIKAFLDAFDDMQIILVLPETHMAAGQEVVDAYFDYSKIQFAEGGRTRFHSVQQGLQLIQEESVIFIHDAVRCLLTPELVKRCYEGVLDFGSAIPVVDSRDSLRILTEDGNEALERSLVKIVQTPQAFHSTIIQAAYQIDYKDKFTDEASVVEAYGLKVQLIPGEDQNIKITYPADLYVANFVLTSDGANA